MFSLPSRYRLCTDWHLPVQRMLLGTWGTTTWNWKQPSSTMRWL